MSCNSLKNVIRIDTNTPSKTDIEDSGNSSLKLLCRDTLDFKYY